MARGIGVSLAKKLAWRKHASEASGVKAAAIWRSGAAYEMAA
jgi:hypothetical protein